MLILGLTGGIAMGKSHVVRLLRAYGMPVFDADAAVHRLFRPGGAAVAPVLAAFPGCGDAAHGIDRQVLGRMVLGDWAALRRLEAIVHPLVRQAERRFLQQQARDGRWLAVLDVPLLLETDGEWRVDRVAVVSAHELLRRQRALQRPGMTPAKLQAVLDKQLPDAKKRKRADFVIPSGFDRGQTARVVAAMITCLRDQPARAWPQRWLHHA